MPSRHAGCGESVPTGDEAQRTAGSKTGVSASEDSENEPVIKPRLSRKEAMDALSARGGEPWGFTEGSGYRGPTLDLNYTRTMLQLLCRRPKFMSQWILIWCHFRR